MSLRKFDRPVCLLCSLKHLAQARAILFETRKGYPEHVWYAIGHLAEAEDECLAEWPALAERIRKERKKLELDSKHFPDTGKLMRMILKRLRPFDV
jgi:hypothetical protein